MRDQYQPEPERPERANWREFANCRGQDTELFFATLTNINDTKTAKRICQRCDVIRQCRAWAMDEDNEATHGVFGGMTEDERKNLRRRQRKGAVK